METEFQVLEQWVRRILRSVLEGKGFPHKDFSSLPRKKFNSKYICESILAPLDQMKPSSGEGKSKDISSGRKRLFQEIDRCKNNEYYYAILYFCLLRSFYEQEADQIIEFLLKGPIGIHPIAQLRQEVVRSVARAEKGIAETDTELLEKVKQFKITLMDQFNAKFGKLIDRDQIINEIDVAFPFSPEDTSTRKEYVLRLAEEFSSKPILYQRAPHRPRDYTIGLLIILMNLYFETLGYTNYKNYGLIAQTINYCLFPVDPFNRDRVRLRLSDQWKKKIQNIERKA